MSLIKKSNGIRNALIKRFEELQMKPTVIVEDAQSRGLPLSKSQLSNFIANKGKGTPSDEIILWLCIRYGVEVGININIKAFDEEKALEKLRIIYPKFTDVYETN